MNPMLQFLKRWWFGDERWKFVGTGPLYIEIVGVGNKIITDDEPQPIAMLVSLAAVMLTGRMVVVSDTSRPPWTIISLELDAKLPRLVVKPK